MKKIRNYFLIVFFLLFVENLYAQRFEQIIGKSRFSMENPNDSVLKTGFYLMGWSYPDFRFWDNRSFKVEYTQIEKDVNLKQKVLFFNRTKKAKHIRSTYKIRDLDKEWITKFIRKLNYQNSAREFVVNPMPFATKENIMRIYDGRVYNADSTIVNPALIIKLNNVVDSLTQTIFENREKKIPVGLIINNELVVSSVEYWTSKNYFFMSFVFYDTHAENIEYYKSIILNQTLIKQ